MNNTLDIEKLEKAEEILNQIGVNPDDLLIKRIKKDKGLIERAESSKIILSEDNRQILND